MAATFSNHQQRFIPHNPNQSLSSSFSPFVDDYETLILQQPKKKLRLVLTCDEEFLNKLNDIQCNPNQSLVSSTSPFFQENQTLIPQQNMNKPRFASSRWSSDESFEELSMFKKPPPVTPTSTAGVFKPPPTVSKSPPDVIVIDDDDEEEEFIANSNDNNRILDSNVKKSPTINDSEEKKKNGSNGGFGHVTINDLGVTIEDLKKIPWEAFDPSLGIKSVMMDPSFGWICSTNY